MNKLIAREVIKPTAQQQKPRDSVILDYEARYLRRRLLTCTSGDEVLVDFPKALVLDHGDQLQLEDGSTIEVISAEEELLEIKAENLHRLTIFAYHLGNRHLPVQIEEKRLLIKRDHVIEDMLEKLQAQVKHVLEPFNPEGGAYGLGRTHGHDHGHSHDQTHEHDHEHKH